MISNHVTCFILFYSIGWTSLFVGIFFFLFSFIPIRVVIGIPECFLACVTPSWNFLMDYIGVYFLWFYLWGGVVCFLECWEVSAPCPSLSVPPWLSLVPSPGAVPVLHPPSDSCLSGCAPCAPAPLRSISLALTVLSWAGETQQKGKQLFRKWGMGFPQFIFCVFLSTCLFLNSVWFVHTRSKTEKRESGAFLLFALFLWA